MKRYAYEPDVRGPESNSGARFGPRPAASVTVCSLLEPKVHCTRWPIDTDTERGDSPLSVADTPTAESAAMFHSLDPDRLGEVLQPVFSEIGQRDVDQRARLLGEQYLPAVPCCADPRALVDVRAHVAFIGQIRGTGVYTDAHLDRSRGEGSFEMPRSRDGAFRRRKGNEESVTLRVDLNASVLSERCPEEASVLRERLRVAFGTQLMQQTRRPHDIREQEGHDPGRKASCHERTIVRMLSASDGHASTRLSGPPHDETLLATQDMTTLDDRDRVSLWRPTADPAVCGFGSAVARPCVVEGTATGPGIASRRVSTAKRPRCRAGKRVSTSREGWRSCSPTDGVARSPRPWASRSAPPLGARPRRSRRR